MFSYLLLIVFVAATPASAPPAGAFELVVNGGRLAFDPAGVSYIAADSKNSRQWSYFHLKQIRVISPRKIAFDTFEDGRRWRFGADRTIEFEVSQGTIDGDDVAFLLENVDRPVMSVVPPSGIGEARDRIDAKHLRHTRGSHGTLAIYAGGLHYDSTDNSDSRYWRFGDIESVLRVSSSKMLISVYEHGSIRTLAFELKSPLSPTTFDYVWGEVNRPADRAAKGR